MFLRTLFLTASAAVAAAGLGACSGGGGSSPAPAGVAAQADSIQATNAPAAAQSVDVRIGASPVTTTVSLAAQLTGSVTLHTLDSPATIGIASARAAAAGNTMGNGTCPPIPPIVLFNPAAHPVTVAIDRFSVKVPCSVDGLLFGASAYQSNPVPQTLVSTKLGDATGAGHTITFTPTVTQLTFPAKTALTISVLPETSTSFTQLPAIAGTASVLTSNAAVPNSLALDPPNVAGGTVFQSACFLPNAGPGLAGIHLLGTPSFYCVLAPGQTGSSTTFGTNAGDVVTFILGPNAQPDSSFVGLDGPPIYVPCTPAGSGQTCSAPAFTIPTYTKAIVSNITDIAVCVPAKPNTDCNGVAGNPKAPSAPSVPPGNQVQLLFRDDATYNAANTFGGVTLQIDGTWPPCTIDVGSDNDSDVPPGYTDPAPPAGATPLLADFQGVGPYVEFDLRAQAAGTCSVRLTEDTGLKRTFVFTIPVRSNW